MATLEASTKVPKCHVIYAPQPFTPHPERTSVFLAGTIDLGESTWQESVAQTLAHLPITILNPHRADWDSTWIQDISCQPFREQTTWELDMFEAADVIAMYMGPQSQAPISLLELGLFARSGKMIVACPDGFWRRGNVQIVCKRFEVELVNSLEELVQGIERRLGDLTARR
jgi:hypothetical protein